MTLPAGSRLGPYEILASLGAGGMGEVYRAKDPKLGREVAVKVLPGHLSADRERLQRFEKEARSASSLNHPNIVTIYEIGQADSVSYIAMELVEGTTLREVLSEGALPVRRLLQIAAQVANGLARAHASGIVHRDLKPENLMVTKDGFAKILDFGLAKLTQSEEERIPPEAPTVSVGTEPGVVMGTVGYMSPEQARGKAVDFRSDQFSLGSVLYEMATGKRAFGGESRPEILAAIIREEPEPIGAVNPQVPAPLRWIVERCLAKEPKERYASTEDLARDLATLRDHLSDWTDPARVSPVAARRRRRERLAWVTAVAGGILAMAVAIVSSRRTAAPVQVFSASLEVSMDPVIGSQALSPDGSRLALVYRRLLWIRPLGSPETKPLSGTDGATMPFWSPDSRFLGFFAGGKLKTIDASGGPPRTLCDAAYNWGGTWSREGVILFSGAFSREGVTFFPRKAVWSEYLTGLFQVSADGGTPKPVTRPASVERSRWTLSHRWPHFLPDGRHFVALQTTGAGNSLIYGSLESGELGALVSNASNAAYVSPGRLLFFRDGNLLTQRFDAAKLRLSEDLTTVSSQPVAFDKRSGHADFSVSQNGVLVYRSSDRPPSWLTWLDRSGRVLVRLPGPGSFRTPRISPDGRSVAVVRLGSHEEEADIWLYDTAGATSTRFTALPAPYGAPVWSPDGDAIDFGLWGQIYRKKTRAVTDPEALEHVPRLDGGATLEDWSPDGRLMVVEMHSPMTDPVIVAISVSGDQRVAKWQENAAGARFSPDGRWMAYESRKSGRTEIYVRPFPGPGSEQQISQTGGESARWRRDGRELYYVSRDGKLVATEIRTSPSIEAGAPKVLFDLRPGSDFDVAADGQRFLVALPEGRQPEALALVSNWTARLER